MSAIAGVIHFDGTRIDRALLEAMTTIVRHRGPDGIDSWARDNAGLAYLSLATTPEAAHEKQPFAFNHDASVLVWDGRLDNRSELHARLDHSAILRDVTDAELVALAYSRWGADAFRHLLGDYAIAIWDTKRQQLVCARDPVGVRPFHYYCDGRRFVFGTEIKQIFQDSGVPRVLDESMLGIAMCSSWGTADQTFYKDVKRLPGGYLLVASREGISTRPFWDPDPDDTIRRPSHNAYVEEFHDLLFDAVRARLRVSDGIGINLSGGVDSSSVASMAGMLRRQGQTNANIAAFSCVHRDSQLDESPFVKMIAEEYQIPVDWVPVDDRWAMKHLPRLPAQDEPYHLHFEAIQQALLDAANRRGARVVLTGEGGDEMSMLGYMLHIRDWTRHFRWASIWRDLRGSDRAYRIAAFSAIRHAITPDWLRRWRGHDNASIPHWVRDEFVRSSGLRSKLWDVEPRSRKENLYLQLRGRIPLLLGGDVRGATFGIEYRHPLWDSRIVEFLSRLPPAIRYEGGKEKPLLRHAMTGVLPEAIRVRSGHGAFHALIERGLRIEETERIRGLLLASQLDAMGIIDARALLATFDAYVAGNRASLGRVLPTLLVEEWLQNTHQP